MFLVRLGRITRIHAPAKLNLFLEVLALRDDGFHDIETLMTPVTIFDTLQFTDNLSGQLRLNCHWAGGIEARQLANHESVSSLGTLPEPQDNIVLRALEVFRVRAGIQSGANVELVKGIPSAAGLGGASSDAAAALVAANHVWRVGWSNERLARLSAELGSDIPFFFGDGAAICRGRGEQVTPVQGLPEMHFVVIRPPGGLSTADVYRQCRVAQQPVSVDSFLRTVRLGNVALAGRQLLNRLQDAAQHLSPWIERIRKAFERLDCLGHQMSGSGTSWFGICRNARHARRTAGRLRAARIGTVFQASTYSAPQCRP